MLNLVQYKSLHKSYSGTSPVVTPIWKFHRFFTLIGQSSVGSVTVLVLTSTQIAQLSLNTATGKHCVFRPHHN